MDLPKRKKIRLEGYDYSSCGAYFVTICVTDKNASLWNVGAGIIRPHEPPLSQYGKIVETAINQIPNHYENVIVDKYCIMPDHVHMIVFIMSDEIGRIISATTLIYKPDISWGLEHFHSVKDGKSTHSIWLLSESLEFLGYVPESGLVIAFLL